MAGRDFSAELFGPSAGRDFSAELFGAKPSKERTFGEAAKDIAASVVSGAGNLVQLPGQLYGLATGDFSETGALGLGKDIAKFGEEMKSAGLKAREQERAQKIQTAEQKGQWEAFKTAFGETIKDPALLTSFLAEQAPQLLVPFGAAKVAQIGTAAKAAAAAEGLTGAAAKKAVEEVTKAAAERGTKAAIGAGAVQQGADVGSQAYEDIYKELIRKGASETDAAQGAINLARAAGASGAIISLLAQRLPGARTLEESFAGVKGTSGRVLGALKGAAGEGASEIAEETGGKFGANLAMREVKPEQSLLEGLGQTAGMAAVGGVGLGGVSGALRTPGDRLEVINGKKFINGKPVEEEAPAPAAEVPPVTPEVKAPAPEVPPAPTSVTPEFLTELGIKPTAAVAKRIKGKSLDDPTVAAELETYAKKYATEEAKPKILEFVQSLKPPAEAPVAPPVAPAAEAPAAPVAEAPVQPAAPVAPPVAPVAEAAVEPSVAEDSELVTPAPVVEAAAPVEPTVEPASPEAEAPAAPEAKSLGGTRAKEEAPDIDRAWRDFSGRNKLSDFDTKATTDVAGEPDEFVLSRSQGKQWVALTVKEQVRDDGVTVYSSALEVGGEGFPTGTGAATTMYLEALNIAKNRGLGWMSESVRSDQSRAIYERLKKAGVPFVEEGNSSYIDAKSLASVDLQKVANKLAARPEKVSAEFGTKSIGGERAQVQAFEQTLRNLLNKFGLKDVGLKILDGMTDSGSYAAQIIRIAADAANPVRTLRHEAIHALRELGFFTDAQWSSLSKMAKDKWIDQYLKQRNVDGKPLKAGEESRYDAYMREYNGDMEKITEEAVSDAFADFDATKPPAGMLQALLKRMRDLFQSIKSALTKVESPEQIFGKVEKGELKEGAREAKGEAKSLRDRATANFKRWFADSKVVDENGEPLVVYHGTDADFTVFKNAVERGGDPKFAQTGLYFAEDAGLAGIYGESGSIYPVYLNIRNPLDLTEQRDFSGWRGKIASVIAPKLTKEAKKAQELREGQSQSLITQDERNKIIAAGYDGIKGAGGVWIAFRPEQIKSAIGNNGDYSLTNADIRKSIGGRNPGEQAISIVNSLGMGVKPPEPGRFEKAMKFLKDAGDNPSLTKESAKKTLAKWLDWFETTVFSSDSAFNNKIRRGIISDFKQNPEVLGMLLEASQSQTVHADALASQFMIDGGLQYNEELKKWESVKKEDNFVALAKKIEELATKYNVTKDEMERIAHTYFVAKRLPGIIKRNEELDAEIKAERATAKPDRKQIEEWESLKVYVSDEQLAMMEPGLSLVKTIPELKEVVDIWQGIRKNNIDVMVNSGLWSPEYATAMWDNMDYVPYYREEQLEEGAGPQEFIRGLQVKSKEFQLKGSGAAVNDVFDNMIRWSQYAMNRAIRAHKATQMIDAALKIEVDGKPMATKVTEQKRGMNIVRAFRDGKQELYDMADPLFVPAFSSIQNVSIPTLTFMSKVSNVLRQSVVLYPLFSVAQVPQDSFAAMFSSGLKTQHALKIPYLAVKEFIKTLSKTSATHNELTKYGVVGVRDFSATIIRNDAEIYAGLKPPKGGWGKTKEFLEHIAMAADNAVRQAVYEASMQQGLNKSEALEKAFEIINFRRRGTSKMLNVMGQTVPFFYAYLSAQRVAYRVLSGVGISPTERKEALTTLATTSAAVAALSMLYAMAVGDDEDYAETPAAIRDRTLTIPGSGGVRIPLRPDFFLFPKIIAEHTYLMLSDKGFEDGAKFRKSMADALLSAVASPTPFPTAIKPAIEVAINYDFFQGKPLIGNFEKQKDVERQFRDSTSELAKLLGETGVISPIAADHMIRGMFGSFGGLFLFGTNQFLHSDPDVPRPEMSANEMLAAMPGTSGLLKRPQESALKNDFYQLRDEVEKAANTFNDIKTRSPEGIQAFLEDEKNAIRLGMAKGVDKINRHLSDIRRRMTIITNMPESQMPADEKAQNIRELRELEREILRSVNVKELREMAKI